MNKILSKRKFYAVSVAILLAFVVSVASIPALALATGTNTTNGGESLDKTCNANGFDFGIAKWEWKNDWKVENESPFPLSEYSITVTGSSEEANWEASPEVAGLVVKAGTKSEKRLGGTSGKEKGINKGDITLDLSNIIFCGNDISEPEPKVGSIKVCKIILDEDGNVVTGDLGTTFTIPFVNENYEGPATGVPSAAVFDTPLTLETVFGQIKGECVTYNDLLIGRYYYGEEQIAPNEDWLTPRYHDQFNSNVNDLSDPQEFNSDLDPLFDNFDGVINLGANQTRTLIVINQLEKSTEIPGCTDPKAFNFNPDATTDDGSCIYDLDMATISALKIVCPTEDLLPNWGAGGPDITSTTASDFIEKNPSCHLENWTFEWAPNGTPNPGDNIKDADGDWTEFSSLAPAPALATVPAGSLVWVREQFNSNYVPFSGSLSEPRNSVSAEFYCHTDVLNYDNYDFIKPVEAGKTYHCVGFNAPVVPPPTDVCPDVDGIQTEGPCASDLCEAPAVWDIESQSCKTPDNPPVIVITSLTSNPSTINQGATSTLEWNSNNATVCQAGWTSATSTSGTQVVSPASTTLYSITCGNGTSTSTAQTTVTVNIPSTPDDDDNGGGGGGGGGGSRSGDFRGGGIVLGASTVEPASCLYLRDYMRIDLNNDPLEVLKLQAFLINFEGHTNLSLSGVFDQTTLEAVSTFQVKYFGDVLEPWGHTQSTGYVYILTLKKINEIYCQRIFPLNEAQVNEIAAFKELLESLRARGINPELPSYQGSTGDNSTTSPALPVVGDESGGFSAIRGLAAAIVANPGSINDMAKSIYGLLVFVIALYVLGNVLKDVFYKNTPGNLRKRFLAKWFVIDAGLALAIVASFVFGWWFILPLFILLVLSLLWTSLYPEQNSIRASVKSWYLVVAARLKSISKDVAQPAKESIKEPVKEPFAAKKETVEKIPVEEVIVMGPKK